MIPFFFMLGIFISVGFAIGVSVGFFFFFRFYRVHRHFYILGDPLEPDNIIEVSGFVGNAE